MLEEVGARVHALSTALGSDEFGGASAAAAVWE